MTDIELHGITCPTCGNVNSDERRICVNCGRKLEGGKRAEYKPEEKTGMDKKDLTTEDILRHQYKLLTSIESQLKWINGKLTFFTVLIVIGLAVSILQSCGSMLGLN